MVRVVAYLVPLVALAISPSTATFGVLSGLCSAVLGAGEEILGLSPYAGIGGGASIGAHVGVGVDAGGYYGGDGRWDDGVNAGAGIDGYAGANGGWNAGVGAPIVGAGYDVGNAYHHHHSRPDDDDDNDGGNYGSSSSSHSSSSTTTTTKTTFMSHTEVTTSFLQTIVVKVGGKTICHGSNFKRKSDGSYKCHCKDGYMLVLNNNSDWISSSKVTLDAFTSQQFDFELVRDGKSTRIPVGNPTRTSHRGGTRLGYTKDFEC
jgi:hypothetical protein